MKPVKFLRSALADLRAEKAYYRTISPELAERFQAEVEVATKAIATQPLAMQLLEFNVRRWPVNGFPHGVLYRVEESVVLVLAIFHPKQDPAKWHLRANI